MRNHYDLGCRRTNPVRRSATEAKAEAFGLRGRRFPLWTTVFISSLLLGTGTAVYAIAAFTPPPSGPKSDAAAVGLADEKRDGFAGSTNGEDAEDTPPVWEDSPETPSLPRHTDKSPDVQKPRQRPPDTRSFDRKTQNRIPGGNRSSAGGFPPRREPEEGRNPPSPTDSSASGEESLKHPVPDIRVAVGYPFWMASQAGKSPSGDVIPEEVTLFGYQLLSDGTVNTATKSGKREDVRTIRSARRSGAPLVPTVAVADPDLLQNLLASQEQRSRTADRLVKWAAERNFDGMDLLLDPIAPSGREHLTPFIEELAEKLRGKGKRLGLHVLNAAAVTRAEWKRWGQAVDRLKIYPYLSGERQPEGKAAPESIDQLLRLVPREKVTFVFPVRENKGPSQKTDPKRSTGFNPDQAQTFIPHLLERHPDIGIQLWILKGAETSNHSAERAPSNGVKREAGAAKLG
ncbi:glycoside hydrolase family 18 protein [Planifilum fimeticola]